MVHVIINYSTPSWRTIASTSLPSMGYAAYSKECYQATTPPPFVCKNMKPDEWVEKALESYPRCCGNDLSECKCPVKDKWWSPFKYKIADYCAKVEICNPSADESDTDTVPSDTSGDVQFLRGGVEDVNEQIQRKELSP